MAETLSALSPGECAVITKINAGGTARRRLRDLGFTDGTKVRCIMKSFCGDPTAFLLRGTVTALRKEEASLIEVSPGGDENERN